MRRILLTLLGPVVAAVIGLPGAAAATGNIVLVHGMNMDGGAWRAVYDRLTSDGYHVTAVQLPMTSIEHDIAATRRAITAQDGPVVLVGHSYGGTVISQAASTRTLKHRYTSPPSNPKLAKALPISTPRYRAICLRTQFKCSTTATTW
ncbi:triacylglycerol lipase [Alkalilimnicola ehrlichii]|uniref:esterase/lipase family protein n=1 Tax=Alkalilimnicola ehrlichii TaxID=351052 RepID=UPI001C6F2906|nr:alpha/beta hydrolase [Alkalilimnicola ehrlichii]